MTESPIIVGVLAVQGAFSEHIQLLRQAAETLYEKSTGDRPSGWKFIEVRTSEELKKCDALVIPGGESTAIALIAKRSTLLEDLRTFVKVQRHPTWGTCAGLILLSESATSTSTKRGGQDLIGGLNVRINRNHFGRQVESFEADLDLPFLQPLEGEALSTDKLPFRSVFIRAPVVERILTSASGAQNDEDGWVESEDTIVAPPRKLKGHVAKQEPQLEGTGPVEVMARLPGRAKRLPDKEVSARVTGDEGDIVAVRQGNVFGTAFHPELTGDARIHIWWLDQVRRAIDDRRRVESGSI